jgi:hypothetical protein
MQTIDEVLEHFGVKGMHWGVRKDRPGTTGGEAVTVRVRAGKRVVTTGGHGQGPHEDAVKAAISKRTAKKSSTDALSTKELQDMVNRMNLEQQYSRLTAGPNRIKKGLSVVKTILSVGKTVNEAVAFANSPAGKALRTALAK